MIFRFHDNNNTGRLIPRITEFSTIGNILLLKLETENSCSVEMLKYSDEERLLRDISDLEKKVKDFYESRKEPMGFSTDAIGFEDHPVYEEDEEDVEDRIGFM